MTRPALVVRAALGASVGSFVNLALRRVAGHNESIRRPTVALRLVRDDSPATGPVPVFWWRWLR
ncbi:MAG TPA: hypothetical protein VGN51_18185 [Acidimicrobiia bacterium]